MKLNKFRIEIALAEKLTTRAEVAKKAGITNAVFDRAMRGLDIMPKNVGAIAKALDVPVESIIEEG